MNALFRLLALATLALVARPASAGLEAPAPAAAPRCDVVETGGLVSARVQATPLRGVIGELAAAAHIDARWLRDDGDEPISVGFDALPVAEALERILAHRNYLFVGENSAARTPPTLWVGSAIDGRRSQTVSLDGEPRLQVIDGTARSQPEEALPPLVDGGQPPVTDGIVVDSVSTEWEVPNEASLLDTVAAAINAQPRGAIGVSVVKLLREEGLEPRPFLKSVAFGQAPVAIRTAAANLLRKLGDRQGKEALARLAEEQLILGAESN